MQDGDTFTFKDPECNKLIGPCMAIFVYSENENAAMVDILTSNGKRIEQFLVMKEEIEIGRNNDTKNG